MDRYFLFAKWVIHLSHQCHHWLWMQRQFLKFWWKTCTHLRTVSLEWCLWMCGFQCLWYFSGMKMFHKSILIYIQLKYNFFLLVSFIEGCFCMRCNSCKIQSCCILWFSQNLSFKIFQWDLEKVSVLCHTFLKVWHKTGHVTPLSHHLGCKCGTLILIYSIWITTVLLWFLRGILKYRWFKRYLVLHISRGQGHAPYAPYIALHNPCINIWLLC